MNNHFILELCVGLTTICVLGRTKMGPAWTVSISTVMPGKLDLVIVLQIWMGEAEAS